MPAFSPEFIRLTPTYIVSLLLTKDLSQYGPGEIHGINDDGIMPGSQQKVNYHGRKVE